MNRNKEYSATSRYGSPTPERYPQQEWSGDEYRGGHDYRADRPYAGSESNAETGRFGSSHDDVQRPRGGSGYRDDAGRGEFRGSPRSAMQDNYEQQGWRGEGMRQSSRYGGEFGQGDRDGGMANRYGTPRQGSTSGASSGYRDYDEENYSLKQQGGRKLAQGWDAPQAWAGSGYRDGAMQDMSPSSSGYYGGGARGYGGYGTRGGEQGFASVQDFSGRGPRGYARSDERLKEDICEKLTYASDIDASEIQIEVQGGKVVLTGEVSERGMKHRAEDLVDRCSGVQEIDNRLMVSRGGSKRMNHDTSMEGSSGSRSGMGSMSGSQDAGGNGHGNGGSARGGAPSTGSRKS